MKTNLKTAIFDDDSVGVDGARMAMALQAATLQVRELVEHIMIEVRRSERTKEPPVLGINGDVMDCVTKVALTQLAIGQALNECQSAAEMAYKAQDEAMHGTTKH